MAGLPVPVTKLDKGPLGRYILFSYMRFMISEVYVFPTAISLSPHPANMCGLIISYERYENAK